LDAVNSQHETAYSLASDPGTSLDGHEAGMMPAISNAANPVAKRSISNGPGVQLCQSPNWSGWENLDVYGGSCGDVDSSAKDYTEADGFFSMPSISSGGDSNTYEASWVGIGQGVFVPATGLYDPLIQAGVIGQWQTCVVPFVGCAESLDYFYEIVDNTNGGSSTSFSINDTTPQVGDDIQVDVKAISNGAGCYDVVYCGTFFVNDNSLGQSTTLEEAEATYNDTPLGTTGSSTSEWITEDPALGSGSGCQIPQLAEYSQVGFIDLDSVYKSGWTREDQLSSIGSAIADEANVNIGVANYVTNEPGYGDVFGASRVGPVAPQMSSCPA
jgi:hypothetical protein